MISIHEIQETNEMISRENLDVRTITLGISLLDCIDADLNRCCDKIYAKITRTARNLVATGEDISREFGIPIANKRISVTPHRPGGRCRLQDLRGLRADCEDPG